LFSRIDGFLIEKFIDGEVETSDRHETSKEVLGDHQNRLPSFNFGPSCRRGDYEDEELDNVSSTSWCCSTSSRRP
ncbi:hypothetical protein LINPERPRIM_LOCUS39121, partial [Linum perenne]